LSRYVNQEVAKRPFQLWNEAGTCNYQSKHSNKGRGNPVKCLAQDTTSELASLPSHSFFMLNVKQGSCEHGRRQREASGPWPLWIFIHDPDIVDRDLKLLYFCLFLLFFGLFFRCPPPPGNFFCRHL